MLYHHRARSSSRWRPDLFLLCFSPHLQTWVNEWASLSTDNTAVYPGPPDPPQVQCFTGAHKTQPKSYSRPHSHDVLQRKEQRQSTGKSEGDQAQAARGCLAAESQDTLGDPAGSPNSPWETLSARGARGDLAPGLCLQQAPIDSHCLEHCRGPDSQEESRCSAHPRKSAQTVQAQRATLSLAGGRPLEIQFFGASQGLNLWAVSQRAAVRPARLALSFTLRLSHSSCFSLLFASWFLLI